MFCLACALHVFGGLASLPNQSWRISRENPACYIDGRGIGRLRRIAHVQEQRQHESGDDFILIRFVILIRFEFLIILFFIVGLIDINDE